MCHRGLYKKNVLLFRTVWSKTNFCSVIPNDHHFVWRWMWRPARWQNFICSCYHFEFSFSCAVSDSNDAVTLLVVVTATHFTSSNTAFCRFSCSRVKALHTCTCVLCICWSFTSDNECSGPTYNGGRILV